MEDIFSSTVKTTVLFEKKLLEAIDQYNPFPTRKEFLDKACRAFIRELRRAVIDRELAAACAESASEDMLVNEDWEEASLENWS